MSITVSSTTDSQEQVNAAAGIVQSGAAPPVETPQEQKPPAEDQKPPYEPDEDGTDDEDEEEQPEKPEQPEEQAKPRKRGGWLRKIEQLERERGYAQARIEQLESALVSGRKQQPEEQAPPAMPQGKPEWSQDQFQTYEEYIEALTDWKLQAREAQAREQIAQWQAQEQRRVALEGWHQRVQEYRPSAPDFEEVMHSVDHIPLPPHVQEALVRSEAGPAVAYELAKNPAELMRIARMVPAQAIWELGRVAARIASPAPPERKVIPSRAPEPIKPVGNGASGNVQRPLDQMDYQDYKMAREQQIAAARKRR